MQRFVIVLIALTLPVLVYWLYDRLITRRDASMLPEPWWARAPWAKLLACGVALAAVILFVTVLMNPAIPSGNYVPPAVQDGKIVPGHVVKDTSP